MLATSIDVFLEARVMVNLSEHAIRLRVYASSQSALAWRLCRFHAYARPLTTHRQLRMGKAIALAQPLSYLTLLSNSLETLDTL